MAVPVGAIMQLLGKSAEGISAIAEGYAARTQARYNIAILEGQIHLLNLAAKEQKGQYVRGKGKYLSKFTSAVAGAGLMTSGSAQAVALGAITAMNIDQAIGQFNIALQRNELESAREWENIKGKRAVRAGWMTGYTKMMRGGIDFMNSQQRIQPRGASGQTSMYSNQYASRTAVGNNPFARGTTAGAQKAMLKF